MNEELKYKEILETILSIVDESIIITDPIGKVTIMNKQAEKCTGWNTQESIGKEFSEFLNLIDINTRLNISSIINHFVKSGEKIKTLENIMLISKDESESFVSCTLARISSDCENNTCIILSIKGTADEYTDVTDYKGFMNANLDILCILDGNGNFIRVNNKFEEVFGYTEEEIKGMNYFSFIFNEDIFPTKDAVKTTHDQKEIFVFTNRFICKDHSFKYIKWHAFSGGEKLTYCSASDVTQEKINEENLMSMAVKDVLTGLYNRYYFNNVLDNEIASAERYNHALSMAIMDIDYFKHVNDTWGHPIGDDLLKHIAETVKKNIRSSDLLIRLGGEEFIIFMPHTKMGGAMLVVEKIRSAIEKASHPIAGQQTASIGVAERHKSESLQKWYERADAALYKAKQQGRNQIVAAND